MPVSICDNVVISAGAVAKDIRATGIYAGVPVKKLNKHIHDCSI